MAETIIIEVNTQSSIENLAKLNKELDDLKRQREALIEAIKEGTGVEKENRQALELTKQAIKQATDEYKTQARVLEGFVTANKKNADTTNFLNNSISANRGLLKQLTAQYNDTVKPSKELTDKIKGLSDVLKQQEAAIGDTRRNVGNYKQDIIDAVKEVKVFGGSIGGIIDPLKNAGLGFKNAGGGLSGILTAGTALIPVFGQVLSVFTQFGPVADFVEQATAGIVAGFESFVSGGSALEAARQVFELTGQLKDLSEEQDRARLGLARSNSEIDLLILKSKDRAKTEEERIKLLKDANALSAADIAQEREIVEEKIKLSEKLFSVRRELSQFELATLIEGDEQIKLRFGRSQEQIDRARDIAKAKTKKSDDEDIKALQDNRLKLIEIDKAYAARVQENENSISKLRNEIQDEQDKKAEKEKELRDKQLKEREKYLESLDKLESEFILNDRQRLEKTFTDKINTITGQSLRETELRLTIEAEKQIALEKFDADAEEKRQQRIAARLAKDQKDLDAALKIIENNANQQLEIQRLFVKTQQEIDDEYAQWIEENPRKTFADFYAFKKKLYADDVTAKQQAAEQQKLIDSALAATGRSVASTLGSIADAVGDKTKEGVALQKTAAFIQLAIDTATSISSAISGAAQAAESTGPAAPFALAGYIASMVAAVVSAVAQASAILNDAPSFALGGEVSDFGVVGGKPHSQGGTKYYGEDGNVVEFEKDEGLYVMKKSAQKEIHMLSQWNQLHGGRSWLGNGVKHAADGGNIFVPFAPRIATNLVEDGGFTGRELARRVSSTFELQESFKQAVANMPRPVVSVKEFEKVQATKNRGVNISEL